MKTFYIILILVLSITGYSQQLIDSRQREIVFTSVNVVPMETETIITNQMVVVKDAKIQAIGKKLKYGKDALVIDARGKYLIPGSGRNACARTTQRKSGSAQRSIVFFCCQWDNYYSRDAGSPQSHFVAIKN